MLQLPKSYQLSKIVVLLFLLMLVTAEAIPSYLKGQWAWMKPPQVATLKELKILRREGLTLPGWAKSAHINLMISGHKWLVQELKHDGKSAILLLLPQNDHKDKPQVEWTDLKGFHEWKTDSDQTLNFTVDLQEKIPKNSQDISVAAQFFRSWDQKQTFAVLQWYAQPSGGSATPSSWFWEDSKAQLFNRRVPWVAVCILIPLEPLADIEKARPLAIYFGQNVQLALMKDALRF
ncbi:cyanoexosortase B system-associated protein [Kamptonema animale CS-326]|jgi:cyanoexosortase B-associated protein|uniref:cyanoexosortase B system-associated protein n=1 Tax=Kamptonema animale TaxID=92934 RepID=UPI00232C6902|nr:cyanoexosortase B system-associated protein [Kamptonema animale]MDB9514223.1 cyanoexosortase B system-associated protein [Kamptonema animale CS-326]